MNKEELTYKGKPLVRSGNTLYYGNPTDDYIVIIQILNTQKVDDIDVADKVMVQLHRNDLNLRLRARIEKSAQRSGLYEALDIGSIWLQRALSAK